MPLNGNGYKPHHIKNLKKVTKAGLKAAAVISNGSPTKMAKLLEISPSTAYQHLKKPELNNLVSSERAAALKKVGITRLLVYGKIKKNLSSGFATKQNFAIEQSLELLGDKTEIKDGGDTSIVVNMPVVIFDGLPMQFKVGNNGHS